MSKQQWAIVAILLVATLTVVGAVAVAADAPPPAHRAVLDYVEHALTDDELRHIKQDVDWYTLTDCPYDTQGKAGAYFRTEPRVICAKPDRLVVLNEAAHALDEFHRGEVMWEGGHGHDAGFWDAYHRVARAYIQSKRAKTLR